MTFKSGFVAILGRPNVGKSTFLNHVMGQKIAIMSDKAQTTRNKIMGIYTTDKEQIVFIDTPGIHKPKTALGDFMVESAYSTLREVDTVLFMVPADEPRGKGDDMIIKRLKQAKVHPETPANKLSKAAMKRVHDQTIAILQLGIAKGGSTIRTYRNALGEDGTMQNYLQVYGKTGQPCPRCASMIVKIKLGGRGTHLCPHCQKR